MKTARSAATATRRRGKPPRLCAIVRLRDTDGDGKADEFKKFAEMESPRGVIWDGPERHRRPARSTSCIRRSSPPITDTDGDGVADKQEDIVTGLGFDLDFRGADHTTNGCRLGIDGLIYIAVGDYGFTKAIAKDGTTLSMRGGGIVRVRPDGTGFEIVSRGQRNIYDVAVSPTLDLFTRDNTNDGGGWNVRLSPRPARRAHGLPHALHKLPRRHRASRSPISAAAARAARSGSMNPACRSGLFTVEWGRNAIMYHTLTPNGAGWKHDGRTRQEVAETRPPDRHGRGCQRRALHHELGRRDVQLQRAERGVCAAGGEEGRAEGRRCRI